MPFVEDLAPFFADFGLTATVGAVTCTGIFDNAYAQALGFTAGTAPVLIVKAADVPAVSQGTSVVVVYGSFVVTDVEPDGTGLLLLRLDAA